MEIIGLCLLMPNRPVIIAIMLDPTVTPLKATVMLTLPEVLKLLFAVVAPATPIPGNLATSNVPAVILSAAMLLILALVMIASFIWAELVIIPDAAMRPPVIVLAVILSPVITPP